MKIYILFIIGGWLSLSVIGYEKKCEKNIYSTICKNENILISVKGRGIYKTEKFILDLAFENITQIKANAFAGLNLVSLNLKNNYLSVIHLHTFQGLKTEELHLEENNITMIEEDAFAGSDITLLFFGKHEIENINKTAWGLSSDTVIDGHCGLDD